MNTRKIFGYGTRNLIRTFAVMIALAFITLSLTGCPPDPSIPTLTDITLNTTSVKKAYNQNEQLNLSGLVVTANYSDSSSGAVTGYTTNLANGAALSTAGTITVTVSYTEGAVTKIADFTVTVTAASSDITYAAIQSGGADNTADTTGIVFTFSDSVDSLNLTAADITVGGAATKGSATLTGSGASWTLTPVTVNAAGLATVSINKDGIEAASKSVDVYKAGKGVFLLRLNGFSNRTIFPTTPSLNDFAVYNLNFTPTNGGSTENVDRTNETLVTDPILLDPGTYNLIVNAYKDNNKTQLMAQGILDNITITAGKNTSATVTLDALSGDTGTFKWDIILPSDVTANMIITPITPENEGGTNHETVSMSQENPGSRTLNSGPYILTFNLNKTDEKSVIWREVLYVYQNLESVYSFEFTDDHFSDTVW